MNSSGSCFPSEEQKRSTSKKQNVFKVLLSPFAFEKSMVRLLFIPLLIRGHVLINDLPGVGKTTLAKAFAHLLRRSFSRLQGTSDTLPQDILGGEILDNVTREFSIKKDLFSRDCSHWWNQSDAPQITKCFWKRWKNDRYPLRGIPINFREFICDCYRKSRGICRNISLPSTIRSIFVFHCHGFSDRELQKYSERSTIYWFRKSINLYSAFEENEISSPKEIKTTVADDILERLLPHEVEWSWILNSFDMVWVRDLLNFTSAPSIGLSLWRDFVIPEDGKNLVVPFFLTSYFTRCRFGARELEQILKKPIEIFSEGLFLIHYRCFPDLIGGFSVSGKHFENGAVFFWAREYSSHWFPSPKGFKYWCFFQHLFFLFFFRSGKRGFSSENFCFWTEKEMKDSFFVFLQQYIFGNILLLFEGKKKNSHSDKFSRIWRRKGRKFYPSSSGTIGYFFVLNIPVPFLPTGRRRDGIPFENQRKSCTPYSPFARRRRVSSYWSLFVLPKTVRGLLGNGSLHWKPEQTTRPKGNVFLHCRECSPGDGKVHAEPSS